MIIEDGFLYKTRDLRPQTLKRYIVLKFYHKIMVREITGTSRPIGVTLYKGYATSAYDAFIACGEKESRYVPS